jgi:SAM-dependent methyltransferase
MSSLHEIQDWWRTHVKPNGYANAPTGRSRALVKLVSALDLDSPAILEIGCNCGRNLKHLWDAGYHDCSGIEISTQAIVMMRERYPECDIKVIPHAVEDIIRSLPSDHYDLVFTMAVLLHLHPDSVWVLGEMVRISAHYIITIECENSNAVYQDGVQRQFARNYQELLEPHGCRQLRCQQGFGDMRHYVLRVFEKG